MQVNNCLKFILTGLFPKRCLLCGANLGRSSDLCPGCRRALPYNRQACAQCGLPMTSSEPAVCGRCTRHPPPYTRTQAPLLYQAPVDRLIGAFKFHKQLQLASPLARLFCQQLPTGDPLPDFILPLPLHPRRLRERGFNQSLELARHVAAELRLPLAYEPCRRVLATPPQRGLDQRARHRNMRRAFVADSRVEGCHLALFDDVITTGASVTAASQALLKAGAARVDIWALARTPLP